MSGLVMQPCRFGRGPACSAYRPRERGNPDYPLRHFTGLRDDAFFQVGRRRPEPRMFMTAAT